MSGNNYIFISGKRVSVDEEIYRAFMRPVWAEQRRQRRHAESGWRCLSLDAFLESGYEPATDERLVDEIVEDKLLLDMLYAALQELTDEERVLIDALYYQEKSERQLSSETGVPRKTIAYRKGKILEKLRKSLEEK